MYKKLLCILFLGLSSQLILSQPEELVFDDTGGISRLFKLDNVLYYSTNDNVNFIDLNDPSFTPQTLINSLDIPTGMEYKDGFLYVAEWGAGKVIKLDLSLPNPTAIDVTLTGSTPNDLLFVGDILYYSSNGGSRIYKYDVNTETQISDTVVVTPNGPLGIEFKDGRLYIALSLFDAIYSIDLNDENAELEVFIENDPNMDKPMQLEFYNDELYIANQISDNILKVDINSEPLITEEILTFNGVKELFIENGILYYNNSAFIYRVDLSSLSLEDLTLNKIKLYPSPAKDEINISNLRSSKSFQLYDSLGRIVKEGTLGSHGKLNVSDLETGSYFIKIEDEILRFMKI